MKKIPVIHPFLFAVYPVLFLFSHNISNLSFDTIIVPILIISGITLIFWVIAFFLLKDIHKSSFVVSMFLILFFSYGHFSKNIPAIFIIWPDIFIVGVVIAFKIKKPFKNVTYILNVISITVIIISMSNIVIFKVKNRQVIKSYKDTNVYTEEFEVDKNSRELPSIYFIILDAYAGPDILEEIYGYDNTKFLNFLKGKGFFIAGQSFSNYHKTFLTVASSLNLDYISSFIGKQLPDKVNEKRQFWKLIRESKVSRFLKKKGYSIVAFSSGCTDTEIKNADIYLAPELNLSEFQNKLINTTPIHDILKFFKSDDQFDLHRKRINFILNNLPKLAKRKQPFFAFAHILAPHPPFVFGANGEEYDPEDKFTDHDGDWLIQKGRLSRAQYIKGYTGQLSYLNKMISKAIEKILAQSEKPPIIILFGDHGPRSMLVFGRADKSYMKEGLSILNAYYLPNCEDCGLYEKISPVNTFRVIFNHYFGTDYDLLKDESYYQFVSGGYFKFINVTDRIKNPNQGIVHYHMANDLLNHGKLEEANSRFLEALKVNPNDALTNIRLGQIFFKQKKYTDALYYFKKAISLIPESHVPYYNVAVTYYNMGDSEESIPYFEKVVKINPNDIGSHFILGMIYNNFKQYDKSLKYFNRVIEFKPSFAEAHYHLIDIYLIKGDRDSAEKHYRTLKKIDPALSEKIASKM